MNIITPRAATIRPTTKKTGRKSGMLPHYNRQARFSKAILIVSLREGGLLWDRKCPHKRPKHTWKFFALRNFSQGNCTAPFVGVKRIAIAKISRSLHGVFKGFFAVESIVPIGLIINNRCNTGYARMFAHASISHRAHASSAVFHYIMIQVNFLPSPEKS